MLRKQSRRSVRLLSYAITTWLALPAYTAWASEAASGGNTNVTTADVRVEADAAQEEAKYESQQKTIITKEDIEKKQAKSVEDIIFSETGVSRTVDAMGRVGISIRGAEPRHTLILVDGQPVLGDLAKYSGAADEVMRLGTENVERIEIIQGAASSKFGSDAIGGVVNIITRKATKDLRFQFNWEGLHEAGDSGIPFSNFFLRADSGQMGKLRLGLSGSKREIVPVYASVTRSKSGMSFDYPFRDFKKNTLRYYGDTANIGLVGSYEANAHNNFEFRVDRYTEDLMRDVKTTDSDLEPMRTFKRQTGRNAYNVGWHGDAGNTDWNVEMNYTNIKEDDVSLMNYAGKSAYEGKNELLYVDNVDHRQFDFKASANTQIGDKHLLTYGFGFTHEKGEGSRLKDSPKTSTRHIDPWDYDKSLLVDKQDRLIRGDDNTEYVWSHIHDYKFDRSEGMPKWDREYEYYYYDKNKTGSINPEDKDSTKRGISYDEFTKYQLHKGMMEKRIDYNTWKDRLYVGANDITDLVGEDKIDELYGRYQRFQDQLNEEWKRNHNGASYSNGGNLVGDYYRDGIRKKEDAPTLNGKKFLEEYWDRDQRLTVGSATIKKQNFYIGDTWQVSNNTLLYPIIRVDHSNLFGTNVSGSFGMTHNVGGDPHRRLKANIGTSYAEPGMGELYYNWEMYGSNPAGIGYAKMGWWWAGNPNLKPEKSVNFDISLEGENKNTYGRIGLFHNRIRDYMTVYFTGKLQDFAPQLDESAKWMRAPDMIYSFKNIGKAEITGIEAEVRHKFNSHWSTKLGYTYLHAINKSDPLMPRRLLDRPTHKLDIGVTYEDKKTGWGATLWGDYYIHMLDSNTLANGRNYYPDILEHLGGVYEKQEYEEKTFGIWNFMLQKQISDDAMVYVGVNNIFNHRDDDRATQERIYRIGANFKFDSLGGSKTKSLITNGTTEMGEQEEVLLRNFLNRPFDMSKEQGATVFGDYRIRFAAHGGTNRPQSTYTANSSVGSATKNMLDVNEHGFEHRIRVGANARVGENTNIKVVGALSGTSGVENAATLPESHGLKETHLEQADVTQRVKKWDLSLGRLTEPMGVTGYWFSKEYDGIRAVFTGSRTQLRLGYGTFKHSTGISDSAYTHSTYEMFYRPPTLVEFLGINKADFPTEFDKSVEKSTEEYNEYKAQGMEEQTKNLYFYQQLKAATTDAEKLDVLKRLHSFVKAAYGADLVNKTFTPTPKKGLTALYEVKHNNTGVRKMVKLYASDDQELASYVGTPPRDASDAEKALYQKINSLLSTPLSDASALESGNYYSVHSEEKLAEAYKLIAKLNAIRQLAQLQKDDCEIGDGNDSSDGHVWSKSGDVWTKTTDHSLAEDYTIPDDAKIELIKKVSPIQYKSMTGLTDDSWENNYSTTDQDLERSQGLELNKVAAAYWTALKDVLEASEHENKLPRSALGALVGNLVKTTGIVLEKDRIPPIDKAFFIQARREITPQLGVAAWYLRSVGDKTYTARAANGTGNDVSTFNHLANVIGVGAKWQMGKKTAVSFDYGMNRTAFGKYMNGTSVFEHKARTDVFTPRGRHVGSMPVFWTARLDIGESDTDRPGTWNAFIDYKYFEHGAFFGGNGTESLPDRYLDGIKSFTIGGGYVPAQNWLVELFYTFDAKGINSRDTLHGPEKFRLGNYTRFQVTYKF
ncbi:TonB-dependent siderophore receptor [Selenomonas sp. FOBRC9]|uniref:TonB-dependent receptor plug domain-containing protein n=1 Tax=Selenomonas sp. FOBRC9 TaxID=936573 RepID=UPI0002DD68D1|nr:TonB-dependent receptor [Selenomonas sp. FOBRC9]